MVSRRDYLASVGAVSVLSGCLSTLNGVPDLTEPVRPVETDNWYRTGANNANTNRGFGRSRTFDLNELVTQFDGNPHDVTGIVERNEKVYISTSSSVHALSESTSWTREMFEEGTSWPREISGENTTGLVTGNDSLYVPTLERLYNLDAETGRVRWEYDVSPANATPLLSDQYIFVEDATGPAVHCLNIETNELNWVHEFDQQTPTGLAVLAGQLYVTVSDSTGSKLVAIDVKSGERSFSSDALPQTAVSPVVSEDRIVVGHRNGTISVLSETADVQQTVTIDSDENGILTPMAADAEHVFTTSESSGSICAIRTQTGEVRWETPFSRSVVPPIVCDDSVYFFATDGQVTEHKVDTGEILSQAKIGTDPSMAAYLRDSILVGTWDQLSIIKP